MYSVLVLMLYHWTIQQVKQRSEVSAREQEYYAPIVVSNTPNDAHLLPYHRFFAPHLGPSMNKGGLLEVEAMHLTGVAVHLGVVLLHEGLPDQSRVRVGVHDQCVRERGRRVQQRSVRPL